MFTNLFVQGHSVCGARDQITREGSCNECNVTKTNVCVCVLCSAAMQEVVSGSWNYSLSMGMFSNLACTKPIDFSNGVEVGQTIYISVDTKGLDGNIITLVTESCWATNTEKGNGLRYDLVTNG